MNDLPESVEALLRIAVHATNLLAALMVEPAWTDGAGYSDQTEAVMLDLATELGKVGLL